MTNKPKLWGMVQLKPELCSLYAEWMAADGYPVASRKRVRRYIRPGEAIRPAMKQILRELGDRPSG